jgi:hypothetical protein
LKGARAQFKTLASIARTRYSPPLALRSIWEKRFAHDDPLFNVLLLLGSEKLFPKDQQRSAGAFGKFKVKITDDVDGFIKFEPVLNITLQLVDGLTP